MTAFQTAEQLLLAILDSGGHRRTGGQSRRRPRHRGEGGAREEGGKMREDKLN